MVKGAEESARVAKNMPLIKASPTLVLPVQLEMLTMMLTTLTNGTDLLRLGSNHPSTQEISHFVHYL